MRRHPRCAAVWCTRPFTHSFIIHLHFFLFMPLLAYPPATYHAERDCPMKCPLLSHLNRLHSPFIYKRKRGLVPSAFGVRTYSYSNTNDAGDLWRTFYRPSAHRPHFRCPPLHRLRRVTLFVAMHTATATILALLWLPTILRPFRLECRKPSKHT